MSKKAIKWLYKELPTLLKENILSSEIAEKLHNYYGDIDKTKGQRTTLIIFSILGSLLIGAGIILLLAYNWPQLSRPIRIILSLLPLILTQILAGWVILRRNESDAWREGTATFLFLMVGASIALIAQTYHISSNDFNYILFWVLLGLPLVYIMQATIPAIIYMSGITAWTISAQFTREKPILFWLFAAFIVPYFIQIIKRDTYRIRSVFLSLTISICICIAIGFTVSDILEVYWPIIYGIIFSLLYMIGILRFNESHKIWQKPFQIVGLLSSFWLSYTLTFKWFWKEFFGYIHWRLPQFSSAIPEYTLLIVITIIAIFLLVKLIRQDRTETLSFAILPIITFIGYSSRALGGTIIFPVILFNLYLFTLGVNIISSGIKNERLRTINVGMLILITLIVSRFFDSGMGFIEKGIAFIIIGIGFLMTNLILVRRWRSKA